MTRVSFSEVLETNGNTQKFLNVYMFFLNEADISSRTGNVVNLAYANANPKNGSSYAVTIFTADEVLQSDPINYCEVHQTGGNQNTNDSIACSPATFGAGDLFLSIGGASMTGTGPLRSNYSDSLINQQSNGMWAGVFYHTMNSVTSIVPYMAGTGNAGRFILLANRIHSMGNPNTNPGNTLPVKLESFTGKNQNSFNALYWKTATEINLNNYDVQRSSDGKSFKSIGMVFTKSADGNSTIAQEYAFNDQSPLVKGYYRLKIVDNDGSVTYSPVIVIDNSVVTASQMIVYPNPSNGTFTISNVESIDNSHVRIMNSFGQSVGYNVLSAEVSTQKKTVQLINPTPGFYYVTYESNGKALSSKVFVQ
jgi:hypothetical protein